MIVVFQQSKLNLLNQQNSIIIRTCVTISRFFNYSKHTLLSLSSATLNTMNTTDSTNQNTDIHLCYSFPTDRQNN